MIGSRHVLKLSVYYSGARGDSESDYYEDELFGYQVEGGGGGPGDDQEADGGLLVTTHTGQVGGFCSCRDCLRPGDFSFMLRIESLVNEILPLCVEM